MSTMKRTVKEITEIPIDIEYKPRNFLKEQEDIYKAKIDVLEGGIIGIVISLVAVTVVMAVSVLIL